jgi:hypothetical protein
VVSRSKHKQTMEHMKTLTKLALMGAVGAGACWMLALAQDSHSPPPNGGPPGGPGRGGHRPPPPPLIVRALDTNHDGIIDANEIANAVAVLQTLDKNGDGQLTPDEYMGPPPGPDRLPKEILDQYDLNKDGKLDETERAALRKDIEAGKVQLRPGHRGPPPPPDEAPPQ